MFGYSWLDTAIVQEQVAAKLGVLPYPPTEVLKKALTTSPLRDSSEWYLFVCRIEVLTTNPSFIAV